MDFFETQCMYICMYIMYVIYVCMYACLSGRQIMKKNISRRMKLHSTNLVPAHVTILRNPNVNSGSLEVKCQCHKARKWVFVGCGV